MKKLLAPLLCIAGILISLQMGSMYVVKALETYGIEGLDAHPFSSLMLDTKYGLAFKGVFLTAHAITVSGVIISFILSLITRFTLRDNSERVSTSHGSSRFASENEIKESGLLEGEGVVLGLTEKGEYLRDNSSTHIKVFAPTRSGKGVGIVVPTLLSWKGSTIVFDPKGENWAVTAGFRRRLGRCIYFNPTEISSHRYNPLAEIRLGIHEVKDAQNVAEMIVDPTGKGELDHWQETGKALLVGAILHTLYTGKDKTLRGVAKLLTNPVMTIEETLEMMLTSPHLPDGATHPRIAGAARAVLNKAFEERSGVHSSAVKTLSLFDDPLIAAATSESSFSISDFLYSKEPLSLYIVTPGSDVARLRPLIRIMINQISKRLTENLTFNYEEEGSEVKVSAREPERRLLLLLDEFPVLGRLEFFESSLAYIAQYGLKALLVSQSTNQLINAYGQHTSIMDNCQTRVFHAPNTIETAKTLSEMIGTATRKRKNYNFSGRRMSFFLNSVSEGEIEIGRNLMTPSELLEMDKESQIIFSTNFHPIWSKKLKFFEDSNFTSRVKEPPRITFSLPEEEPPVRAEPQKEVARVEEQTNTSLCI